MLTFIKLEIFTFSGFVTTPNRSYLFLIASEISACLTCGDTVDPNLRDVTILTIDIFFENYIIIMIYINKSYLSALFLRISISTGGASPIFFDF